MKKMLWCVFVYVLAFSMNANAEKFKMAGSCDIYFSPNGKADDAIVAMIDNAQISVHMIAYSFTSIKIADALVRANKRLGKTKKTGSAAVSVILDRTVPHAKKSALPILLAGGMTGIVIDTRHAITHDKYILVDGKFIEQGSYNYTENAEKNNAENAMICRTVKGYDIFFKDWKEHYSHATPACDVCL